jgi:hypothetical protein
MELLQTNNRPSFIEDIEPIEQVQTSKRELFFINANTIEMPLQEIKTNHIIPVYHKTNETVISQIDFVETVIEVIKKVFPGERILNPDIRVSHPVKGRIPEAKDKPAKDLQEYEKTIYYERMAFMIEFPGITDIIGGNRVCMTVGGIKNYGSDNLSGRKGDESFKVLIGFQNKICLNLCVWSDGVIGDLKVKNKAQLNSAIYSLFASYDAVSHLQSIRRLENVQITAKDFAQLIGRCKMYPYLPKTTQKEVHPMEFTESQIAQITKGFFWDDHFCCDSNGTINLWRLFNLFTRANKSSYIDTFLDRSINAYNFLEEIRNCIETKEQNWYLN